MTDQAQIVEIMHDAHPKEIRAGDIIRIGRHQEADVQDVWRTGTGPHDSTWVDVGLFWPLQISHASRLNIKRPARPQNGSGGGRDGE